MYCLLMLAMHWQGAYPASMSDLPPHIETFEDIYFVSPGASELDVCAAPAFRQALVQAIHDPESNIIVADLSTTDFLDSTGLGVLISGLKRCRELEKGYYIDITSDHRGRLQKIFEITGLVRVLEIITPRDSEQAA